jgi:hypothetical protein
VPADLHSIVVRNPETGVLELHVIVSADDLEAAGAAIVASFEAAVNDYRSTQRFGGHILFVVRGPVPGDDLPPALAAVQSALDARRAGTAPDCVRASHTGAD